MHWKHPAAEIYLGLPGYYLTYFILILGLSGFGYIMFKRYNLIRLGKPRNPAPRVKRSLLVMSLISDSARQLRPVREQCKLCLLLLR